MNKRENTTARANGKRPETSRAARAMGSVWDGRSPDHPMRLEHPLPPSHIPVEEGLDRARQWQDHVKRHRQHTLRAPYPKPEQWVRNDEGEWKKEIEDDVFPDEYTQWEWNVRNMRYHDWTDRNDPSTDIGYVKKYMKITGWMLSYTSPKLHLDLKMS